MKKYLQRMILALAALILLSLDTLAQGIVVTKTDNTKTFYKAATVESFGVYEDGNNQEEGIVVTKADGTKVYYKATEVVSVGVYGYGEEPRDTNGHEAVDLGLSVMWATMNVGASAPEEYGDYFAWGEITPKSTYNWSTYKYCNGSETSMTKYCTSSDFGTVDNKTTLELEDDAAFTNWGGTWRMPTDDEWEELYTQCTWTLTTQNGVKGYKGTSKTNGNSIFLPGAGKYRDNYRYSAHGHYWSSSLYTWRCNEAFEAEFELDDGFEWGGADVSMGKVSVPSARKFQNLMLLCDRRPFFTGKDGLCISFGNRMHIIQKRIQLSPHFGKCRHGHFG